MIVGVGCGTGVSADAVVALVSRALDGRAATAMATIAAKVREPGLVEAAARLGLPLLAVNAAPAQDRCVTRSDRALAATGVASVAEGAALAAAGPDARLVLARIGDGRVTVAVAL